jgi:hypothetical protein
MKVLCYLYLIFTLTVNNDDHILIGDSQTFYLKKHSTIVTQNIKLSQSGIGVLQLIKKIDSHNLSPDTKSITICIGVNDAYVDKGVEQLMTKVKKTFPNATIFVIKGSWGWGTVKNLNPNKFNDYYKKFEDLGAHIVPTPIGHGDPHKNKKVYKTIMTELENNLKNG